MKHTIDDSNNIIGQMINAIVGKEDLNMTNQERELRMNLAGRAAEYFMFMDDDEELDNNE